MMAKNVHAKVAIIGAGPAGIAAAYYLKQKGYKSITVFEKENHIGGKCYSVSHQGQHFDLGATLVSPSNRHLLQIIKQFNIPVQPQLGHHLIYHPIHKTLLPIEKSEMLPDGFARTLASLFRFMHLSTRYRQMKKPGYFTIPPELAVSFDAFIVQHKLSPLKNLFTLLMTNMGYGKLEQIPAFTALKFLKIRGVLAFFFIAWTGRNYFKVVRIEEGFQSVWERVAKESALDVRLQATIQAIRYQGQHIIIQQDHQEESFDQLIVAAPLDKIIDKIGSPLIDPTWVHKIRYLSYTCHLFKIRAAHAWQDNIFVIPPPLEAGPLIVVAYPGKDHLYVSYSANELHVTAEQLRTRVRDFICQFGVQPEAVEFIDEKQWSYFPHVSIQDVQEGFYDYIHARQGVQNTYYTGGLLAFESVELCVSFSKYVVETYF